MLAARHCERERVAEEGTGNGGGATKSWSSRSRESKGKEIEPVKKKAKEIRVSSGPFVFLHVQGHASRNEAGGCERTFLRLIRIIFLIENIQTSTIPNAHVIV
jgi:hypothetical protein